MRGSRAASRVRVRREGFAALFGNTQRVRLCVSASPTGPGAVDAGHGYGPFHIGLPASGGLGDGCGAGLGLGAGTFGFSGFARASLQRKGVREGVSVEGEFRRQFLDIVRALSQQEYEAHRKAFEDLEAKAHWLIGCTSISTAIAAWLTSNSIRGKPAVVLLLEALFLFIAALLFALVSMRPREIAGPPSAAEANPFPFRLFRASPPPSASPRSATSAPPWGSWSRGRGL